MTSRRRPPISVWPERTDVVVPGKFDVFARAPHRMLKSVVLPVFGLPSSATRPAPAGTGACGSASASGAVRAIVHDEDVAGHDTREADTRGPDLDDEGLADLADA